MNCSSTATTLVLASDFLPGMLCTLAIAPQYDIRAIKRTELRKP